MDQNFNLPLLPLNIDFETKKVLKEINNANKALAELKGISKTIPNSSILINTLVLQEAKNSSEIENIITTHDELFKSDINLIEQNYSTKEVQNYSLALKKGFQLVEENGILINRFILEIQEILENNKAGIRTQAGTALRNSSTQEIIYTPPQDPETIKKLLKNLEEYINSEEDSIDPLIKMAIIHYQFESIHPFYDGNGRTGRIINVLYLVLKKLIDLPILYLSRYIIQNKAEYYRLLQEVRTKNNWEDWLLYMLKGVEQTAKQTITIINKIKKQMAELKIQIRNTFPKIYSKDLLEVLFLHPYTKIDFLMEKLNISRQTASKYLTKLQSIGIIEKHKLGKHNYYINVSLYTLFLEI